MGSVRRVLSHFQPRLFMAPRSWPRAGFEAQFDPEAQGVPTGSSLLGRQVGEDDPRFFLLDVPDDQQGAAAFGSGGAEGGAATDPRGIGTGNEVLGGQPAASLGAEGDAFGIPHVGMPAPRSWPGAGSERVSVATISDWPGPGRTARSRSFPWEPPGPVPAAVPLSGPSRTRAGWRGGCARPREWRNPGKPR